MSKFSAGQKVVCIDGYGKLNFGEVYIISRVDTLDDTICLDDGTWWNEDRFEASEDIIVNAPKEFVPSVKVPKIPHVHAEIIKLWADGDAIQVRDPDFGNVWDDITLNSSLSWNTNYEYRAKPEVVYPESLLSGEEIFNLWMNDEDISDYASFSKIANIVLKHAIDSGQVAIVNI